MPLRTLSVLAWILASNTSGAQSPDAPAAKAAVGSQNLKIVYGSAGWNLDSTRPDNAFLFLRDKTSGKLVKIQLEETEPDSSIFSGSFSVDMGHGAVNEPEVFIPPRHLRDNDEAVKKFSQLLAGGKISAKPLIVKADDSGLRTIDVYDTAEQASRAQQAFFNEQRAKREQSQGDLGRPIVKSQDLEAAKIAEQRALFEQLKVATAKREAERVRIEQIERQRAEERERMVREMTERERAARKKQAAELAAQGLAHYQAGEFQLAEEKFRESVDLDPLERSYYFRYGVTLYRSEKFNEALVIMKISPDDPATAIEKKYYMGLIHLRLKELETAYNLMREVGSQRQSPLAPSAAFYEGVIQFTRGNYQAAIEPFERVIDTSQDPRLDEQAEKYLEKIQALLQQEREMAKRWFLSGSLGTMYDSNVLYAPDTETAQGSAAREEDIRLVANGDVEYRFLNRKTHEFGAKGFAYYLYSSKDEVSRADPFLVNLSAPFSYKGVALGKGYKFALKPALEIVYMDANSDSRRETILQSLVLAADNTFVMRANWFATYTIDLRRDDSQTQDSVGDNNADAFKTSLKTTQMFLLNNSQKEALIANAGIVMNNAQGDEKFYNRYEIGVTYMRPTESGGSWSAGLQYYLLNFSKSEEGRSDNNVAVNIGYTKPVADWWGWNLNASYANNASSESANQYSRYAVGAAALFNYSQ